MHHSEQKCVHLCFESCIVGYGRGALWDLWDLSSDHAIIRHNCIESLCPLFEHGYVILQFILLKICIFISIYCFTRDCLAAYVLHSEESCIVCPYKDKYTCNVPLQERELRAVSECRQISAPQWQYWFRKVRTKSLEIPQPSIIKISLKNTYLIFSQISQGLMSSWCMTGQFTPQHYLSKAHNNSYTIPHYTYSYLIHSLSYGPYWVWPIYIILSIFCLTHGGLVMPYGNIDLVQHWFR